jgi:predicted secreted protein
MPEEVERISAALDEPVEIVLRGVGSAGATWTNDSCPKGITLERSAQSAGEDLGSPSIIRYKIRAKAPGTYRIRFVYKRPWEDVIRSIRIFELEAHE